MRLSLRRLLLKKQELTRRLAKKKVQESQMTGQNRSSLDPENKAFAFGESVRIGSLQGTDLPKASHSAAADHGRRQTGGQLAGHGPPQLKLFLAVAPH